MVRSLGRSRKAGISLLRKDAKTILGTSASPRTCEARRASKNVWRAARGLADENDEGALSPQDLEYHHKKRSIHIMAATIAAETALAAPFKVGMKEVYLYVHLLQSRIPSCVQVLIATKGPTSTSRSTAHPDNRQTSPASPCPSGSASWICATTSSTPTTCASTDAAHTSSCSASPRASPSKSEPKTTRDRNTRDGTGLRASRG